MALSRYIRSARSLSCYPKSRKRHTSRWKIAFMQLEITLTFFLHSPHHSITYPHIHAFARLFVLKNPSIYFFSLRWLPYLPSSFMAHRFVKLCLIFVQISSPFTDNRCLYTRAGDNLNERGEKNKGEGNGRQRVWTRGANMLTHSRGGIL